MTNKYVLYLFISVALIGCDPLGHHECIGDTNAHDFTDTELEWFSYELFDTLYFLNTKTADTNYLYCANKEMKDAFNNDEDRNCDDGFTTSYYKSLTSKFHSNFSHFKDNNYMDIDMLCNTAGEIFLIVKLDLIGPNTDSYFLKKFDNVAEKFDNYIQGRPEPIALGNIYLQGKEYQNVFAIPNEYEREDLTSICYDTIYYNKDGFLKFISSQYEYRLERLP